MTLDRYRSVADRLLEPFVTLAARLGVGPNGVSTLAFLLAGAAGVAYLFAGGAMTPTTNWLYAVGALCVALNGLLDLVDGSLARRLDVDSPAGDLLDHVLDRYADILIVAGLAGGIGRYGLGLAAVTGVVMTSYLGTQAQAVGLDRVYGGLVGRADRLVIIVLVTLLVPLVEGATLFTLGAVGWLLVFFAVVGHVTAFQRFYYSMRALS